MNPPPQFNRGDEVFHTCQATGKGRRSKFQSKARRVTANIISMQWVEGQNGNSGMYRYVVEWVRDDGAVVQDRDVPEDALERIAPATADVANNAPNGLPQGQTNLQQPFMNGANTAAPAPALGGFGAGSSAAAGFPTAAANRAVGMSPLLAAQAPAPPFVRSTNTAQQQPSGTSVFGTGLNAPSGFGAATTRAAGASLFGTVQAPSPDLGRSNPTQLQQPSSATGTGASHAHGFGNTVAPGTGGAGSLVGTQHTGSGFGGGAPFGGGGGFAGGQPLSTISEEETSSGTQGPPTADAAAGGAPPAPDAAASSGANHAGSSHGPTSSGANTNANAAASANGIGNTTATAMQNFNSIFARRRSWENVDRERARHTIQDFVRRYNRPLSDDLIEELLNEGETHGYTRLLEELGRQYDLVLADSGLNRLNRGVVRQLDGYAGVLLDLIRARVVAVGEQFHGIPEEEARNLIEIIQYIQGGQSAHRQQGQRYQRNNRGDASVVSQMSIEMGDLSFQPARMAMRSRLLAVVFEIFRARSIADVDRLSDIDALMRGMERLAGIRFHESLNFMNVMMYGNRLLPHEHPPAFIREFWGRDNDEQVTNIRSYLRAMFFHDTPDGQGGTVSSTFPPALRARFLDQAARRAQVWEENQNRRNGQNGNEGGQNGDQAP